MTEPPKQLKVFLCHSSQDKPAVRELYRKLNAEGWIDPWLDEEKLLPGQDWDYEIEKALDRSDAVIVILSTGSVSKEGYVQKELRFALEIALEKPEGTIFILPVRIDDCERPRRLRSIQGVDYFPPERYEGAYFSLLRSLEHRAQALGIPMEVTGIDNEIVPSFQSLAKPVEKRILSRLPDSDLDLYVPPEYLGDSFTPPPARVKTWTFGGIEFVKVLHGEFQMGSKNDNPQAAEAEKPQFSLDIPYDFLMARFPITNEQFAEFVKAINFHDEWGVRNWKNYLRHPVVNVNWHHAVVYCDWLNEVFGSGAPSRLNFRLPTEEEWEKAARGTNGYEYPWGNEFDLDRCNSREAGIQTTTPVGAYSPDGDSPYGVCDMSGNVWEWTKSLWGREENTPDNKYSSPLGDGRENFKATGDVLRVLRGGSFKDTSEQVRAPHRFRKHPNYMNNNYGFRVVLAPHLS